MRLFLFLNSPAGDLGQSQGAGARFPPPVGCWAPRGGRRRVSDRAAVLARGHGGGQSDEAAVRAVPAQKLDDRSPESDNLNWAAFAFRRNPNTAATESNLRC